MQHTPQLRPLPLIFAGLFLAGSAMAASPDNSAAAADDTPAAAGVARAASAPMQTIEVTATHLKSARIDLSPKIGTTVYSIDKHGIDMLGQGDNTPFNEVLLRLPGVAQDSKASGSSHLRDDHANVQYRINGVQLPESISGFGNRSIRAWSTRSISSPAPCPPSSACAPPASSTSRPRMAAPSRTAARRIRPRGRTTRRSMSPSPTIGKARRSARSAAVSR